MQISTPFICIRKGKVLQNKSVTIDKITKTEKQRPLIMDDQVRDKRLRPVYLEEPENYMIREEVIAFGKGKFRE